MPSDVVNRYSSEFDDVVASVGDSITAHVDGLVVTATIKHDSDSEPPWEHSDGHGDVSEWTTRDKRPGERVLSEDDKFRRYYDYAGAIKKAKAEGWDSPPYGTGTAGERAVRAVEHDFEYLKAWCDDEWQYCSIVLSVSKAGVVLDDCAASCGMLEVGYGDASHLNEVANELLEEAVKVGKQTLKMLCES